MSGVWLPPGKQTFVDPLTGEPMVGGLVYHWIPGTDTPKDTWADEAETVLNTNPIVLDGAGQCTIWGEGLYRQRLVTAAGVQKWDEITGFASGGATVNFASPAQVLAGVSNDTVISPFALAASGVLSIPYASPAEVLAGVIANKVISPASLANSGVIPIKATALEVAALANDTKFITPKALGDSGVLAGGGAGNVPSLSDFGWIGDNVTNNFPFMAAMLSSGSWDMRVPTGTFYIAGSGPAIRATLQKRFWGPGKFRFDDGYVLPGRYSYIPTPPAPPTTTGTGGFFNGDTESTEPEWHVLGPGVRQSPTAQYFQASTIPHPIWYEVFDGGSGMLSRATAALAPGAGSAVLISTDGITAGMTLAVTPWGQGGAITDTIIVDTVVGATITFHPNLTTNYPNSPPDGFAPGLATFYASQRTWNGVGYIRVTANPNAAGDVYGQIWRGLQGYQGKAGQIHCFNRGTVGLAGGDINWLTNSSGTYATGWENLANDQGNNVAYAAFVDSFERSKDDIAFGMFWGGHVMQSAGSRPADVAVEVRGNWRFGLDTALATMIDSTAVAVNGVGPTPNIQLTTVRGVVPGETLSLCDAAGVAQETLTVLSVNYGTNVVTFTANYAGNYPAGRRVILTRGGAAVQTALGQVAIVFNSSSSSAGRSGDPTGAFGVQYGNVTGDLVMRSGNDGLTDFWTVQFLRAAGNDARLRLRPNGMQLNSGFTLTGSVASASDVVCGPASRIGFGVGSGFFFTVIAGHIYATIDNGGSYGLIR